MGYAVRRTSARLVLVVAIGGLVWAVYRALHREAAISAANLGGMLSYIRLPLSSTQDLAAAALGLAVLLVFAAVLWRGRAIAR